MKYKQKIDSDLDDMNNGEKLKNVLQGQRNKIDKLTEAIEKMADIQILGKGNWRDTDDNALLSEQLGNFARAIQRKDEDTITKMGGMKTRWGSNDSEAKVYPMGDMLTKANLGTVLTGDDSEGTGGSYLLPQQLYQSLVLRTPYGMGSGIVQRCNNVNMPGRSMRYPTTITEFAFTHVTTEATDKTEQIPTFGYKDLIAETYAGFFSVTDELMDDEIVDIGSIMRQEAIEALAVDVIEEQILNSNGAPATGILNDSNCASYVIDSISFDGVTWDDLHNAVSQLTKPKQRRGGAFIMHPTVWDILVDKKTGTGLYYFDPSKGAPKTAWGYDVLLSDVLPSSTATETPFIIFGNLKNALHGTRIGMEMKYFDQTFYAVQSDQNFFRIRSRQGFVVGVPANFVRITTAAS